MEPKNAIDKLAELVAKLPEELRSDWDGTNHYEMSGNKTRYNWWLDMTALAHGLICQGLLTWLIASYGTSSTVENFPGTLIPGSGSSSSNQ